MLSRVANRLYWIGRYIERAENSARLLGVYSNLLLDLPAGTGVSWHNVVAISGGDNAATARRSDSEVLAHLLSDRDNPSSLLMSLTRARENARNTREVMPSEVWRAINELYLFGRDSLGAESAPRVRRSLIAGIIGWCQLINGRLSATMSHDEAYQFLSMGRHLERADMTTRIIDVAAALLMQDRAELELYRHTLWVAVLRSLSAYQMYRLSVRRRVTAPDVLCFLLQDRAFPRSVCHCLDALGAAFQTLPLSENCQSELDSVTATVANATVRQLDVTEVHKLIDDLQGDVGVLHDTIAATWFRFTDRLVDGAAAGQA